MTSLPIRTRLVVYWLSALGIVLVTFSVLTYFGFKQRLLGQANSRLNQTIQVVRAAVDVEDGLLEWNERVFANDNDATSPQREEFWIVSLEHTPSAMPEVFRSSRRWNRLNVSVDLLTSPPTELIVKGDPFLLMQQRENVMLKTKDSGNSTQPTTIVFTAAYPLEPDLHTLWSLGLTLALTSFVVWAVFFFGSVYFTRKALMPLIGLAQQASKVDAETITARLNVPADAAQNDEVALVARAFNECLQRLELAFRQQQRFTSDASHELRTPLSIINGEIEVALRRERSNDELREVLQRANKQVQRLTELVEKLLFLGRAKGEQNAVVCEKHSVECLVDELRERWRHHPRYCDIQIRPNGVAKNELSVHEPLFSAMMDNLVDNATKYSPPGTPIVIEARPGTKEEQASCIQSEVSGSREFIAIDVIDNASGVDDSNVPHLFEPFFRSDSARIANQNGMGLGLSIVSQTAELFGGRVSYARHSPTGSRFTVLLPLQ